MRPSTRERVVEAIEALNYRPSSLARGLSLQRTMVVVAVLPWFTNPSAVQRVRDIVERLSSKYDLMVFDVESEGRQRRAFELFDRGDRADRLLVVSALPPEAEVDCLRWRGCRCSRCGSCSRSSSWFPRPNPTRGWALLWGGRTC